MGDGDMNQDWLEIQRKYWEQLSEMGRGAMGTAVPAGNPWESAVDHWWQAVSPAAPEVARDFMGKMVEQGKVFFRMADGFTRDLSAAGDGGDGWQAITRSLDEMQKAFGQCAQGGDDALHRMMAFWELPYDNWQRMMSSLSPVPGDLLRNMPHDQVNDSVKRFLSAPGLGYTREEQSQYQDLLRRNLSYQKALQEYMGFFSHIGVKAVARMREALERLDREEKSVDSARGLYDTWVGCCEEVYAEEVQSPEYARIHGQLVNAQMALKQRMSVMVDETLGALNMPTRSELKTLQDRLQETRREYKALRREVELLRRQLAAEPPAAVPTAASAPVPAPRKKAVARKKAPTARSGK
jgi:class III poly(R)-hydroxyalkanoic acid synthase PhaE subunit